MAVYWMTESIPISVTALLPFILMPWLGVVPAKEISGNYFKVRFFPIFFPEWIFLRPNPIFSPAAVSHIYLPLSIFAILRIILLGWFRVRLRAGGVDTLSMQLSTVCFF